MNYSELCTGSGELLGTGRGSCAKSLGTDVKFFLSDSSFTGTAAQLKTKAYWDAAIKAGTVIPFPDVKELEPQNVEAAYQETASGDTYKTKNEKRKTMYKFVENIVTHSGMKSYSDRTWYVWFFTKNRYLRCHTIGDDSFQGLKVSNFYVNAQETATFSTVEQTPVVVEFDDVDDWDMEFGVIQPEFDMKNLEGVFQTKLKVISASNAGSALTVNVSVSVEGSNSALTGALPADFKLLETDGTPIAISSANETPNGTYAIVTASAETTGTVSLNGNISIGSDLYKSNSASFSV